LFFVSTQLLGMLDEFGAGILLARLVRSETTMKKLQPFLRQPWLGFLLAFVLIGITLAYFWPRSGDYWYRADMVIFWRTGVAASASATVFAMCCLRGSLLLLVTKPLRYLGTISYGIFLWHLLVIEAVKRVEGLEAGQQLWIVLFLTFLLASGSWHFYEKSFVHRSQ
jgi:peptidoglycan/LPS O-acetylase OafA/YrhL